MKKAIHIQRERIRKKMDINKAFPSDYLKAHDCESEPVYTIKSVSLEKVGDDEKPVMHFTDTDKSLVLNKTNAGMLSAAYGKETTEWHGRKVKLVVEKVSFQGRIVDGIRVKTPKKKPAPEPVVQAGEPSADFDDEIPF